MHIYILVPLGHQTKTTFRKVLEEQGVIHKVHGAPTERNTLSLKSNYKRFLRKLCASGADPINYLAKKGALYNILFNVGC